MTTFQNIPSDVLKNRHRLSQQQIHDLTGNSDTATMLEEKMKVMAQVSEFLAITDIFSSSGIKFISVKGPLLSYRIYKDATYRQYNDFDFLIDIPSVDKVIEIIVSRGYFSPYDKMPTDECRKNLFYRHATELFLNNPEKNVNIEIHWTLFANGFASSMHSNKTILANLGEMNFAGRKFTIFNPEFDLLYLVIHGGLHSFRRLKWLVDIKDFIEKIPFDQGKFLQLTQRLNASRMVALGNEVLSIYFPGSRLLPSSGKASKFLINFTLRRIEMEKDEEVQKIPEYLKGLWFLVKAFPGFDYKLSIFQSAFYATDLASNTKIPCIPILYYLISPFYKLFRGFR